MGYWDSSIDFRSTWTATHHFAHLQSALHSPEELQVDAGAASTTATVEPPSARLHAALPHCHYAGTPDNPLAHDDGMRHSVWVCNTAPFLTWGSNRCQDGLKKTGFEAGVFGIGNRTGHEVLLHAIGAQWRTAGDYWQLAVFKGVRLSIVITVSVCALFRSWRLTPSNKLTLQKALVISPVTCWSRLTICGRHPAPASHSSLHDWQLAKEYTDPRLACRRQNSVRLWFRRKAFRLANPNNAK